MHYQHTNADTWKQHSCVQDPLRECLQAIRASFLLHTACVRSCCNWCASCVPAILFFKETRSVTVPDEMGARAEWKQKKLLAISYVLPSCYLWCPPSNLFTSNKMSSSTRRAWYVRHSQDFPPRAHYMYEKHFHDTQPWPLCCISPAPMPSAIALLHHKWLKRTHEVLNFWNSRNLKSWSHLFKFLYITQLSYKRMFHNRLILRSDFP
jgi:hypothetical protein